MLSASFQHTMPMAAKEKAFYERLGRRIAERRKALDITQVELAQDLGIAQQTMAHYEGGVSRVVDPSTQPTKPGSNEAR
jgi:DNA-binding XRE family transcriptional regulator